jgi:hypothetical protein
MSKEEILSMENMEVSVQNRRRLICRRKKPHLQNTNINEILRTPAGNSFTSTVMP